MKCDLGNLVPFYDIHSGFEMWGYWIFEQCPFHANIKSEIEKCKHCDFDGQMEVFIECDEESHKEQQVFSEKDFLKKVLEYFFLYGIIQKSGQEGQMKDLDEDFCSFIIQRGIAELDQASLLVKLKKVEASKT